jgi:hypothetical protein
VYCRLVLHVAADVYRLRGELGISYGGHGAKIDDVVDEGVEPFDEGTTAPYPNGELRCGRRRGVQHIDYLDLMVLVHRLRGNLDRASREGVLGNDERDSPIRKLFQSNGPHTPILLVPGPFDLATEPQGSPDLGDQAVPGCHAK